MTNFIELAHADDQYEQTVTALDISDTRNSKSILNVVDTDMAIAIKAALTANPELFETPPEQLQRELAPSGISTSPALNRIRVKFWDLYDHASTGTNVRIRSGQIYSGVCTTKVFWKLMESPEAVAWVMCPPSSYIALTEEALNFGLEQMRGVLDLNHVDAKGRPNTRLIELKLKITMMLDMRKHGAFIQRSEQKSLNLNFLQKEEIKSIGIQNSVMKIEEKFRQLKERDNANLSFVESTILTESRTLEVDADDKPTPTEPQGDAGVDEATGHDGEPAQESFSFGAGGVPNSFGDKG